VIAPGLHVRNGSRTALSEPPRHVRSAANFGRPVRRLVRQTSANKRHRSVVLLRSPSITQRAGAPSCGSCCERTDRARPTVHMTSRRNAKTASPGRLTRLPPVFTLVSTTQKWPGRPASAANLVTELLIVVSLILLNGLFALSELAIVSARRSRLKALAASGRHGANHALTLASDPSRFLSAVQIGITLIGIVNGVYSGETFGTRATTVLTSSSTMTRDHLSVRLIQNVAG
jgi:hypothetical protein